MYLWDFVWTEGIIEVFCRHWCSDDDLTPYDMSGDQEISKASPPRYLRDCLESTAPRIIFICPYWLTLWFKSCVTSSSSNIFWSVGPSSFNFLWGRGACGAQLEGRWGFGEEERLCNQGGMTAARQTCAAQFEQTSVLSSVTPGVWGLNICYFQITFHTIVHVCLLHLFQISVQLTKVLLHMEDKYSIIGFLSLRQATMVALTVTDCIPVWSFTSSKFILITTLLYHHF